MELCTMDGSVNGQSFELTEEITTIGRSLDNHVQLGDLSVSRKHAKITRNGSSYYLEDLGSQNGTWVNGHPLDPGFQIEIKEGDIITFGHVLLSAGEPYSADGMTTQFSIGLLEELEKDRKDLLYRDRQITDRDKLEMMYGISTALMQSLDIDELGERMLESVFSCLNAIESGALVLIDQDTGEHTRVIGRSRKGGGEKGDVSYSQTIVNRAVAQCRAIMMSDANLTERLDFSASMIRMQVKSVMCVPLVSKAEICGVLYVHSISAALGFTREDLFFLTALSSPAALAIENALLFSKHTQAQLALQKAHDDLESRVQERTADLLKANDLLKKEIAERTQAEEKLRKTTEQLQEANRSLERAYAQMKEPKDRVSARLYGEEIVFLTDENGHIRGVNEKGVEVAGKSRIKLLGRELGDLLEAESKEELNKGIRQAWTGLFHKAPLRFSGEAGPQTFEATLISVSMENAKMLLLLLRKPA
jgi:pSer/pThr/pTyr-binding forkhead associated (FHA) protein/PAS domain-containing protein